MGVLKISKIKYLELEIDGEPVKIRQPSALELQDFADSISGDEKSIRETFTKAGSFIESLGFPKGLFLKLPSEYATAVMNLVAPPAKK